MWIGWCDKNWKHVFVWFGIRVINRNTSMPPHSKRKGCCCCCCCCFILLELFLKSFRWHFTLKFSRRNRMKITRLLKKKRHTHTHTPEHLKIAQTEQAKKLLSTKTPYHTRRELNPKQLETRVCVWERERKCIFYWNVEIYVIYLQQYENRNRNANHFDWPCFSFSMWNWIHSSPLMCGTFYCILIRRVKDLCHKTCSQSMWKEAFSLCAAPVWSDICIRKTKFALNVILGERLKSGHQH